MGKKKRKMGGNWSKKRKPQDTHNLDTLTPELKAKYTAEAIIDLFTNETPIETEWRLGKVEPENKNVTVLAEPDSGTVQIGLVQARNQYLFQIGHYLKLNLAPNNSTLLVFLDYQKRIIRLLPDEVDEKRPILIKSLAEFMIQYPICIQALDYIVQARACLNARQWIETVLLIITIVKMVWHLQLSAFKKNSLKL